MAVELSRAMHKEKPWGVTDLTPWSMVHGDCGPIGEIWFERPGNPKVSPALLLKLLFTRQPLSIQVHPDDAFARSMGLSNGKTEAWYVLRADVNAKVALGFNRSSTTAQLTAAAADGSIADLVDWRPVVANDVITVPARTVHAIGAGLVIAEIQQRSDTTYRLFDYGRPRELQIERAIAVADTGPAPGQTPACSLTQNRQLLVSNSHFVLERIDLAAGVTRTLQAIGETWLLILSGSAHTQVADLGVGDCVFAQADSVEIEAGSGGFVALIAYPGRDGPAANLLQLSTQDCGTGIRGPLPRDASRVDPQIEAQPYQAEPEIIR